MSPSSTPGLPSSSAALIFVLLVRITYAPSFSSAYGLDLPGERRRLGPRHPPGPEARHIPVVVARVAAIAPGEVLGPDERRTRRSESVQRADRGNIPAREGIQPLVAITGELECRRRARSRQSRMRRRSANHGRRRARDRRATRRRTPPPAARTGTRAGASRRRRAGPAGERASCPPIRTSATSRRRSKKRRASPAAASIQMAAELSRRTFTMNSCSLLPPRRAVTFWLRFLLVEPTGPATVS